jgi:hypothetical protein
MVASNSAMCRIMMVLPPRPHTHNESSGESVNIWKTLVTNPGTLHDEKESTSSWSVSILAFTKKTTVLGSLVVTHSLSVGDFWEFGVFYLPKAEKGPTNLRFVRFVPQKGIEAP